ncbi:uncharacterized protein LOC124461907 [Drosophila willistoni]|uniref:uncharacterized protein LOC124461907 n=1 Tax=Drosophila willistoni TaxID=7260 RepID=UPI001F0761ED|nr:uncharacterized protein LOC124461907 [Drosophila willistoni]
MFRQIWVNDKHRDFQRIVWRERPSDPIKHYQLCTVTYGTTCAPFLVVRVLEQLASDHQQEFPNAAKILQEDFYVDDVLTGSNSEEELIQNRKELIQLMSCANLELGKWVSNTPRIPTEGTDSTQSSPVKVLGLYWQPGLDTLSYNIWICYNTDNIELHGFSDASTKAYAAVVYSRVINKDGSISTSIMAAKSRVAPLKQQSLTRLELCAALLLSQLIRSIKAALRHQKVTVFAWCDSSIVLYWLSYAPSRLKTFVGNRSSEILDTIPRHYWRHVDSKSNPADCASRGLMAADLKDFQLWWNGPSWIRDADQFLVRLNNSQVCLNISEKNIEKEVKSNCLTALVEAAPDHPLDHLVQRVSSWLTLVHTVGYVLRFLRCTKGPFGDKGSNCLTFEEFTAARIRSQLAKLSPMIDKDGLLRVGGRLHHSQLSTEAKHPVWLPKSHRITKLILEYEHRVNLHPGVSSLFVMRHHTSQQRMADLPSIRVTQALPFVNTGCDYAGPILLKDGKGRKPRIGKGYICLFVCLVTSAIHLELVTDLSTDSFLAALRRFVSLRGKCKIYSDNGTNFIGAKRSLDEMQKLLASQPHIEKVRNALANDGIQWVFIPPHAPHWGGKWESAVRCVKLPIRRVIGKSTLTYEQMRTLLAQVSAVVNSRPLCYNSDTDTNYLSPAHFLIGRPLTTIPEADLGHIPVGRLGYWQSIQSMMQGFWKQWHQEYLTTLQQRPKWTTTTPNIAVGDVVLVKESNTPPAHWHLALVLEAYPGKDQLVRAVRLKTSSGELTRPITKVAVLPRSETVFQGGPGCSGTDCVYR